MKLYDFLKISQNDFDTEDTIYCAVVTVCYIEEDEANDNYDKFCIELMKKVEVEKQFGDALLVKWTELIQNNMEKFRKFTKENWYENCQYENDEDEFIYQWINEIHQYMAGNVSEDFYDELVKLVESLEA
jgi:hypothetical protein